MSAILDRAIDAERMEDILRNEDAMGIRHVPGQWSTQWAKAETAYYRRMAINAGECPDCGFKSPAHEDGCRNKPYEEDEQ